MSVLTSPPESPPAGETRQWVPSEPPRRAGGWRRDVVRSLRRDWQLYTLVILPLAYFAIFRYLPMAGNVIAFRQFQPGGSLFGDYWVGLQYVQLFIHDFTFWQVFFNTLILGGATLIFTFPLPIILALLLNEIRAAPFKRFVQSVSYLPHFLSIVVVAAIILQFVALGGPVNQVLQALGHKGIPFIQQPFWFRPIYVISEAWQTTGWGTILYLAALTTVDPNLYEAARIDGANRFQEAWHVTLPSMLPTTVTLLVLGIGTFLQVGFEKVLLLQNPLTYSTADVITTYLYRLGIVSNSFSYAAAIGLFEGVIGLVMIVSANLVARRVVGTSLW